MCVKRVVRQQGMTLVELVMAIALTGLLIAGLMTAYSSIVGRSADPMIRTQAIALAESYLEEVMAKPCLNCVPEPPATCPLPPAGNRENFNNVCDYHNYSSSSITLPNGAVVAGLAGYSVSIAVVNIDANELGSILTNQALRVTVSVTSPLNEIISLVGYRTEYESP